MSKDKDRRDKIITVSFLVLLWFLYNVALLFFIDIYQSSGYHSAYRSYFHVSPDNPEVYALNRVVAPLLSGIGVLYVWEKQRLKNTRIAWLAFAFVVAATFIYTLATPIETPPSDKPTIVCDKNGENCHGVPARHQ